MRVAAEVTRYRQWTTIFLTAVSWLGKRHSGGVCTIKDILTLATAFLRSNFWE